MILIVDYDPCWPRLYEHEAARVVAALRRRPVALEHIGSTAVPGLAGKPVIDLLLALSSPLTNADARALKRLGYEHLRARPSGRLHFRKGAPRTHCLHVVQSGSDNWDAALHFRDYLRAHPDEALRYGEFKREVSARYGSNRAAYAEGKRAFIAEILRCVSIDGRATGGK